MNRNKIIKLAVFMLVCCNASTAMADNKSSNKDYGPYYGFIDCWDIDHNVYYISNAYIIPTLDFKDGAKIKAEDNKRRNKNTTEAHNLLGLSSKTLCSEPVMVPDPGGGWDKAAADRRRKYYIEEKKNKGYKIHHFQFSNQ